MVLIGAALCGCSIGQNNGGSESAARNHFGTEFKKWISGEQNEVSTMEARTRLYKEPISFDIRSIVKDEPDFLATKDTANLPTDWKSWPAYKLNVAIEWKSKAGTPITSVTTYKMTWNAEEKRWYINERF